MVDLELRVLECRSGLMVYQEKILAKFNKFKVPNNKKEALDMEPIVPQNAMEALNTLSEAHKLINDLYDISVTLGNEARSAKAKMYDREIENSKLRAELNRLKNINEEVYKKVFSSETD